MKKYSITFGNGIYFDCWTSSDKRIQVGQFVDAWYSRDLEDINSTIAAIKEKLPDAQLSIVTHEPVAFDYTL